MSFADMAVMETFRLLDKVRAEGPKERPERPNIDFPQVKPHKPSRPKEPKSQRTDPLRILDPGRKKLTTVESQRILAVLDESIKNAEVVSVLPYACENVNRFSVVLGVETVVALQEHQKIESGYKQAVKKLNDYKNTDKFSATPVDAQQHLGTEDDDHYDELQLIESRKATHSAKLDNQMGSMTLEDDQRILIDEEEEQLAKIVKVQAQQLQFSCQNVLRLLSINPSAVGALRAEAKARDQEATSLIGYMKDLRGFILERLLTTPLEEKEKTDYLRAITIREQKNSEVIKKLSGELQEAIEDKDTKISKQNDEIRRLKGDLHQLEKFSEEHIRRTKSEAEKQQQADFKNSEVKQTKLQTDLQGLRTQLTNQTSEHRESELALRKRKYMIETEVENWIQKYDQDMGERQAEFEDLDTIYTEEKAQLNELEERFKTLEEEYKRIVEERRIAREKKEREERELAMMIKAATMIQSFWRSYKCRKALKSKGKKGKKGKGKKGKKR